VKAIIIGATGYIGSKLFSRASEMGPACGTTSREAHGNIAHLNLNQPGDFVAKTVKNGDIVYLTAAISAPDVCAKEKERAWSINVTGTTGIIQSAIDCGARVMFFSSDTVYGDSADFFNEDLPCNPSGEYAEMKREVEQRFTGVSTFKSIRLSYVFSKEDKFTRYLVSCALKNETAELYHPFYRSIIYREDVIQGAFALTDRWKHIPQQFINFGGPQLLSRIEFAETIRESALKNLVFKVSTPDREFFRNRPSVIAMTSPILTSLLQRSPLDLSEAVKLELVPRHAQF
jgi:dTDP-4-dehydrorhamnose reductase